MKKQILLVVSILLLGFSIVSAQTPKTISGGVLNGKAQNLPAPEFPAAAKAVNASGTVNVQVTIDEDGNVTSANAVSGHPLLRSAAVDAARQAKFTPTQLSGQAVKVTGVIVYNFHSSAPPVESVGAAETGSERLISGGVVNGKAKNLAIPAYPAAAKAVGAEGAVNVQVTIDENGDVVSASAVSGHPLLRSAAEQAARASKFSPTMLEGQPVRVTGIIIYNFVGDKPPINSEEKLKIMGLAAYLTIYNTMDESDKLTNEELSTIPQIAGELSPLNSITKETSRENKAEIISKVTTSIENKLSGDDAWQFQFGKAFAEVLLEVPRDSADNTKIINESAIKTSLLKMKSLLFTAPADLPVNVLDRFRELTKFSDVQNLNSTDNRNRLTKSVIETLNLISPDSTK